MYYVQLIDITLIFIIFCKIYLHECDILFINVYCLMSKNCGSSVCEIIFAVKYYQRQK